MNSLMQITDFKTGSEVSRTSQRLLDRVNAIRVPTIAAINVTFSIHLTFDREML